MNIEIGDLIISSYSSTVIGCVSRKLNKNLYEITWNDDAYNLYYKLMYYEDLISSTYKWKIIKCKK